VQTLVLIRTFKGQFEFLWMTVMLVFTAGVAMWPAPAKAPADRNMPASAMDSVIVFKVFVMVFLPVGDESVELEMTLEG
jgi:hypothetical protein